MVLWQWLPSGNFNFNFNFNFNKVVFCPAYCECTTCLWNLAGRRSLASETSISKHSFAREPVHKMVDGHGPRHLAIAWQQKHGSREQGTGGVRVRVQLIPVPSTAPGTTRGAFWPAIRD